ncbi:MAG TPA: hypothetical protein PKM25_16095 [Candidatus Ozemobacteraceae bacterium]|nr:hypothetical protein [Candidatus Ozemobacteraceae bacterium]
MTILIFSFGLLPLIVLFQSSHKSTAQAKNLMIAQSLGRTVIDEIRSLGFEGVKREIENSSFNMFHDWKQVKGKLIEDDDQSITWPPYYERFETKILANPDDESNPTKYRIEMEVRWREPDRTFSLGFGTVVVNYASN